MIYREPRTAITIRTIALVASGGGGGAGGLGTSPAKMVDERQRHKRAVARSLFMGVSYKDMTTRR